MLSGSQAGAEAEHVFYYQKTDLTQIMIIKIKLCTSTWLCCTVQYYHFLSEQTKLQHLANLRREFTVSGEGRIPFWLYARPRTNAHCSCWCGCCVRAVKDKSIPSFSGKSHLLLGRVQYVSRDVSVVMRFKPLRSDGLLLYTAQYDDGRGDFLSLSLRHGYVEFR